MHSELRNRQRKFCQFSTASLHQVCSLHLDEDKKKETGGTQAGTGEPHDNKSNTTVLRRET